MSMQRPPRRQSIEQQLQMQLIEIRNLYAPQFPLLWRLCHIPNGGLRSKGVAGQLKAMGVRPGVPDLFLPVRNGGHPYGGLFIEMKKPGGVLSIEQRTIHVQLLSESYCVQVCDSVDAAWSVLCWYLHKRDPDAGYGRLIEQVCKTEIQQNGFTVIGPRGETWFYALDNSEVHDFLDFYRTGRH